MLVGLLQKHTGLAQAAEHWDQAATMVGMDGLSLCSMLGGHGIYECRLLCRRRLRLRGGFDGGNCIGRLWSLG